MQRAIIKSGAKRNARVLSYLPKRSKLEVKRKRAELTSLFLISATIFIIINNKCKNATNLTNIFAAYF
jgi:hypothetical protein